jgi:hypothetical protein
MQCFAKKSETPGRVGEKSQQFVPPVRFEKCADEYLFSVHFMLPQCGAHRSEWTGACARTLRSSEAALFRRRAQRDGGQGRKRSERRIPRARCARAERPPSTSARNAT